MSRSRKTRVQTLRARLEFLRKRVVEKAEHHSGYDRAELAALEWALPILHGHCEANRVLQEQLKGEKDREEA